MTKLPDDVIRESMKQEHVENSLFIHFDKKKKLTQTQTIDDYN